MASEINKYANNKPIIKNKAVAFAIAKTAIDTNKIIKEPLIVCNTGSTTISETLLIFTKTEADKLFLLFPIKNSYC